MSDYEIVNRLAKYETEKRLSRLIFSLRYLSDNYNASEWTVKQTIDYLNRAYMIKIG